MNLQDKERELIEEFDLFEDWMEKYNYLIDLGKALPPMDDALKTEQNLVSGCQSRVWINAEYTDGMVHFQADSDALIPKGIVAVLLRVMSGHSPEAILNADLKFIKAIGLEEHLSPNRANGLMATLNQMKKFALVFKAQKN